MLRYKGANQSYHKPTPVGTTVPVPVPVRLNAAGTAGVKFLDMFELNNIVFFLFCIRYIFMEKSHFFPF
jgi:hypothetical protein